MGQIDRSSAFLGLTEAPRPPSLPSLAASLRGLLDHKTLGHSYRVARLSSKMGQALDLEPKSIKTLELGGLLHDIGKRIIPMEILEKPSFLLPEERRLVEQHAAAGVRILQEMEPNHLPAILEIVRWHHERLDGSGYPDGLRGEEIPQHVQIVAVADVYDALISDRPYRPAMTRSEALACLHHEGELGKLDSQLVGLLEMVTPR